MIKATPNKNTDGKTMGEEDTHSSQTGTEDQTTDMQTYIRRPTAREIDSMIHEPSNDRVEEDTNHNRMDTIIQGRAMVGNTM
jgi:hypothetical protein